MRECRVGAQTQRRTELPGSRVIAAREFPRLSHPGELGGFLTWPLVAPLSPVPSRLGTTHCDPRGPVRQSCFHSFICSLPPFRHYSTPNLLWNLRRPARGFILALTPRRSQSGNHRAGQRSAALQGHGWAPRLGGNQRRAESHVSHGLGGLRFSRMQERHSRQGEQPEQKPRSVTRLTS